MRYLGRFPQGVASRSYWVTHSLVGAFDLAIEDNELLAEHRVFGNEIRFAAGHIGQRCSDESDGGWLDPLFDPATKIVAEIEKRCEHTEMVSRYLVDFPV